MKNPDQIKLALRVQKHLGTPTAAKYLRYAGWSLEAAVWVLARR